MIIDFKELSALVPEKGSLILTFKRSNGKMTVCLTVTGTPEELNEEWNRTISEIAKNERLLTMMNLSKHLR